MNVWISDVSFNKTNLRGNYDINANRWDIIIQRR